MSENLGPVISAQAAADLRAKLYYLAIINTTGKAALGTAGAACIGVLKEVGNIDEVVAIQIIGESPVVLGGSVTAGDPLASDANGKAVTAVAGNAVVGIAKESGSANEEITMVLMPKSAGTFPVGTQGDALYFNGSAWVVLHADTAGKLFATGGPGANPSFSNAKGQAFFCFHMKLAKIADGDLITDFVPGFAGKIKKFSAIVSDPATTGSKASTLHPEIGAAPVTGGSLALTSANMTPLGHAVDASAITAANVFTATDAISIVAASTTTFVEGEITLVVVVEPVVTA